MKYYWKDQNLKRFILEWIETKEFQQEVRDYRIKICGSPRPEDMQEKFNNYVNSRHQNIGGIRKYE